MILVLLVLGAILAFVVFSLMRAKHMKHKLMLIMAIFVVIILGIGYFAAVAGKGIDFNTVDGMTTAGKLYVGWLANSFNNMGVLTGNAVALDWRNTDANITVPTTFTKVDSKSVSNINPTKR
jgi:hypothetical protein